MEFSKNIKDYPTFSKDPFTIDGIIERKKLEPEEGEIMVNTDTGEYLQVKKLGKSNVFEIDTLEFRKIFVDAIPNIATFNTPALKVWCYFLMNLIIKQNKVIFNFEECKLFTGYTTIRPIYDGLCELLHKKFIAKSTGGSIYYINKNYFFNGKRN